MKYVELTLALSTYTAAFIAEICACRHCFGSQWQMARRLRFGVFLSVFLLFFFSSLFLSSSIFSPPPF